MDELLVVFKALSPRRGCSGAMLGQGDAVEHSPGSAAAPRITGCSEEQHFTCLSWCHGRGDHEREEITAQAAAAGDISPPSGHGQSSHNGEPHPERWGWRWIWDPRHAGVCVPCPQPAPAAKGNVAGSVLAVAPSFSITHSPIPSVSRGARRKCRKCRACREQQGMLSLPSTHHPGLSHLPRASSALQFMPSQTSRTCL